MKKTNNNKFIELVITMQKKNQNNVLESELSLI